MSCRGLLERTIILFDRLNTATSDQTEARDAVINIQRSYAVQLYQRRGDLPHHTLAGLDRTFHPPGNRGRVIAGEVDAPFRPCITVRRT